MQHTSNTSPSGLDFLRGMATVLKHAIKETPYTDRR
jgi:hypothetical protein